jgi:cullin 1
MHRALREAFESFCNRQIEGTSTAELMASYVDLQLRKGEKLNEEEVEKTLEKVVKTLVYVNNRDVFAYESSFAECCYLLLLK